MELIDIEKSIIKKYRKPIYTRFVRAVKEFNLINEGDVVAVCISGGKDSFLLAKCMEELQIHSIYKFELKYIVMDPGYSNENIKKIKENLKKLNIKANIFKSDIFDQVIDNNNMCYLCARKRRGALYNKAKELGCNKIALGHHFDDIIETIILNIFYAGVYKTMMPKLKSTNYENMELIRPLYYVHESDIISWAKTNELNFLNCACRVTKKEEGKRKEIKALIKNLKENNPNIDINILRSSENVNFDAIIGYLDKNEQHHFLDNY